MDSSSNKRLKTKHVKLERNSVIVNDQESDLVSGSNEQVECLPMKNSLNGELKLTDKNSSSSSLCSANSSLTIKKAIKVEMLDETNQEAICVPTNLCQSRASPTMDIRPVQLHATGSSFHANSFLASQQQALRGDTSFHCIDRSVIQINDRTKLWNKVRWNSGKLRRSGANASIASTGVKKASKRVHTNNRERQRQQDVSEAFQELRSKIPTEPVDKKLSKCTILTRAIEYIKLLNRILDSYDQELCVQTSTIVCEKNTNNGHDHVQCKTTISYAPTNRSKSEVDSSLSPSSSTGHHNGRRRFGLNDDNNLKRFKANNNHKCRNFNESSTEYEFESSSIEISSPSTMSSASDLD